MSSTKATSGARVIFTGIKSLKFEIPAQKASPAPPIGPALGQYKIRSFEFCKKFNEKSKIYLPGIPVVTEVLINPDISYEIILNVPNTRYLVFRAAGVTEPSEYKRGDPYIGKITLKQLYEIAKIKSFNSENEQISDLESMSRRIAGSAKIWGIEIVP